MTKEASVFEYEEIIIPMHETLVRDYLRKASLYEPDSIERRALLISARLIELHIQYLRYRIVELRDISRCMNKLIVQNKKREIKLREELNNLGIDIRDLL